LDQGLAEKDTGNKGKRALLCKPSRDVDSRKLFLAVMLTQGSTEKRHGRKGHCYANQGHCYANQGHCYANQVVMWIHTNHSWQSC
jgi:hypothetical protein